MAAPKKDKRLVCHSYGMMRHGFFISFSSRRTVLLVSARLKILRAPLWARYFFVSGS